MSETIYTQALHHLSAIQSSLDTRSPNHTIAACRSAQAWLEADVWDLEHHDDFAEHSVVHETLESASAACSPSRLFRVYAVVTTVLRDLIESRP